MASRKTAAAKETTRGGWIPTGTSADRRAIVVAAPGVKATRTRERLLDAARVVFARHGYLDTNVEHIITEAGVSRGSFYTYFESKTELFRHLASTIDRERDCCGFFFSSRCSQFLEWRCWC